MYFNPSFLYASIPASFSLPDKVYFEYRRPGMEAVKTEAAPSFETVWAILQEVGKKQEEHAKAMEEQRKR